MNFSFTFPNAKNAHNIERALGMLGIVWCASCGRPHFNHCAVDVRQARERARRSGVDQMAVWTWPEGIDGKPDTTQQSRPELVCITPESLQCFASWYRQRGAVFGDRIPRSIAWWILEALAFVPSSQWHGVALELCADWGDDDQVPWELLMGRRAGFGAIPVEDDEVTRSWAAGLLLRPSSEATDRELLAALGFEYGDDEWLALVKRIDAHIADIRRRGLERAKANRRRLP